MSQPESSSAAGVCVSAVGGGDESKAPATPSQPAKPLQVIRPPPLSCTVFFKQSQVQVDAASLQSPIMEVDGSGSAAPSTPAANTLDAANKQQEEDLKQKYGILPNRAALLRRDYQKVPLASDSGCISMLMRLFRSIGL